MFDSDLLGYLWLGTVLLSTLILLAGALVPAHRPRRLSDWLMIGGVGTFFSGLAFLVLLLVVVNSTTYWNDDYQLLERITLAVAFMIPCGLLTLSAGFLVSRFELRRERLEGELRSRAFPPAGDPR